MKRFTFLCLVCVLWACTCGGCTYAKRGDFTLLRFGYDTKVGNLDYSRDQSGEKLHVNDLDSKATAADTINELVKKIPVAK